MKINMGSADRTIRLIAAVVFTALYFTKTNFEIPGFVPAVIGPVFVLTGLVGFCPLYLVFRNGTNKKKEKKI